MEIDKEEFISILYKITGKNIEQHWETNLGEIGIDSMASIELLLEIEESYDISFPDELLTTDTFLNARNLWKTVELICLNEASKNEELI